ncbi:uncharacterized protein [Littorina saxatilis]|uniref:Uncharacterized protein n=1 Tax=Littorina saxatilis TaxID=31220 RepID=A0AAN9GH36_9CAEN
MGVNQAKISNETGNTLHIVTFSNTNKAYWFFRDFRQPPDNCEEIEVNGLAGGGAVKVGVIYNMRAGRFIFDLFRVHHKQTLTISEVTEGGGVKLYSKNDGVELVRRGMSIRVTDDHAKIAEKAVSIAGIMPVISVPVAAATIALSNDS